MQTQTTVARCEKIAVAVLVAALVLWWNWQFVGGATAAKILDMNDVGGILEGYRQTPNLFIDGLQWWHGSWIQEDTHVFRPVSSYLLWIESWIGLHWGFIWSAWIGVFLLIADCLLSVVLAWRFTRSKVCALLAAVLAPALRFWNWGGTQPSDWLAWYPVHHDLLMIGFLLGALLCFDLWLETTRKKYLVLAWAWFVLGALSKEFVYIFPLMAAALALGRPSHIQVSRKDALVQVGSMLALAAMFFFYRMRILVDPYNPISLKKEHLIRKPFLYWFPSYYRYIPTETYWYPGLSVLLFALAGTLIKLKQSQWKTWMSKPFAWLPVSALIAGILCAYCTFAYSSPLDTVWYMFDAKGRTSYLTLPLRLNDLLQMVFTLYTLHLVWKYRRQESSIAALLLLVLAYVPVFTFLGWHYCIAGWFIRSAVYWPLVVKLIWLDTRGMRERTQAHCETQCSAAAN